MIILVCRLFFSLKNLKYKSTGSFIVCLVTVLCMHLNTHNHCLYGTCPHCWTPVRGVVDDLLHVSFFKMTLLAIFSETPFSCKLLLIYPVKYCKQIGHILSSFLKAIKVCIWPKLIFSNVLQLCYSRLIKLVIPV